MKVREAPCPTNKPHPTGMKLRTLRRGRRLRPLLHTARPAPEHQCLCHTARLPLNAGPTARPAPDCLRPRCAHGPLACCTRHAHGLTACAHSVFSARLPALACIGPPSPSLFFRSGVTRQPSPLAPVPLRNMVKGATQPLLCQPAQAVFVRSAPFARGYVTPACAT